MNALRLASCVYVLFIHHFFVAPEVHFLYLRKHENLQSLTSA